MTVESERGKEEGWVTQVEVRQQLTGYHPYREGRGRERPVEVDLVSRGSSREHSWKHRGWKEEAAAVASGRYRVRIEPHVVLGDAHKGGPVHDI